MFLCGFGLCNVEISAMLQAACLVLLNFTLESIPRLLKCIFYLNSLLFLMTFDNLVLY